MKAEIARSLKLSLDVVLVRKVGLPGRTELAVITIAQGAAPSCAANVNIARMAGLSNTDIADLAVPELAKIEQRYKLWHGGRAAISETSKTVVVLDDGIATGATMKVALDALRQASAADPALAVPVALADTLADLHKSAGVFVCLS